MFDPGAYGEDVRAILQANGGGRRPMSLVFEPGVAVAAPDALKHATAPKLFPRSQAPEEALAGLWIYFDGFDQAHTIVQDLNTPEAAYWHAILHRREPDAGNAGYWFRRVGQHPVLAALKLDPLAFVQTMEETRQAPGSEKEALAKEVQLREWQELFDYCARPK